MKGLTELERRCPMLREEVEHLSEKQEVLAEGHAEDSTRKVSGEDLRGVQGDGGTEGRRSKEAQADEERRRKGKGKDHAKVGGVRCNRSMVRRPRQFLLWFLRIPGCPHRRSNVCSSRMVQEVDDVTSESSWTALAKGEGTAVEGEVEKLEVSGPWFGTKGDSLDPKGKMGQKSDCGKVTRVEKEKLKEDEMNMDVDAPQEESAETKSPKWKVIRVESEPGRSRGNTLCSHEDQFISATIAAVRKLFVTGSSRRWWLKRMKKPTQSICVSSATMKSWRSRVTATEIAAMKRSSGEEGASWKDMDSDGK